MNNNPCSSLSPPVDGALGCGLCSLCVYCPGCNYIPYKKCNCDCSCLYRHKYTPTLTTVDSQALLTKCRPIFLFILKKNYFE